MGGQQLLESGKIPGVGAVVLEHPKCPGMDLSLGCAGTCPGSQAGMGQGFSWLDLLQEKPILLL